LAVLLVGAATVWWAVQPGSESAKAPPATEAASAPPPVVASAPPAPVPEPATAPPPAIASPPAQDASTPPPAAAEPAPPAPPSTMAAQPPAAPPATPPPEDPIAAARPAVKDLLAGVPCSVFTAEATPEHIRLFGLTGLGDASWLSVRGFLQRSVGDLLPSPPVEVSMRRVDGPYCALFDTLKRAAVRFGPNDAHVNLALGEARPRYLLGSTIKAKITLPDFPARVTVDYFTADGMVAHWLTTERSQPAKSELSIDTWKADKPFGTNVIAVIASSSALVAKRPDREMAADYLKDLKAALEAESGGRVKAQLRTIEVAAP
jgi:hypothetical protein